MMEKRFYATGKRKTAIARIYMKEGAGTITVNKRTFDDYFTRDSLKMLIQQPPLVPSNPSATLQSANSWRRRSGR